jgi:hypothetical protein
MKSKLRLQSHSIATGENIIEVWHEGTFLATIARREGPTVRIVAKHNMTAKPARGRKRRACARNPNNCGELANTT